MTNENKLNRNKTVKSIPIQRKDRNHELESKGWLRRSIIDDNRLDELIETYEGLGFDVHLEPLSKELLAEIGEACQSCYIGNWDRFKIIYTRKK
jgi:hypothetical protein